ncbi:MAG: ATP-binding cassette domain-containing protein, partial [bacterium]|nr:ATP-binding cassette domain-containing protein [bacterium]
MTSILTLNNVNYRIGKKDILQDVSFDLPQGEIMALLGSNGAGKTTLMQLLLGLLKPTSGEITSCGFIPHKQGRKLRPLLGFVPAVPDVYSWMTPRELFKFLAPQYKTWDKEIAAQDSETLKVPL